MMSKNNKKVEEESKKNIDNNSNGGENNNTGFIMMKNKVTGLIDKIKHFFNSERCIATNGKKIKNIEEKESSIDIDTSSPENGNEDKKENDELTSKQAKAKMKNLEEYVFPNYYSLAPRLVPYNYELYKRPLDRVLNDTTFIGGKVLKKNKNIAITGGYSTGKSSIIRTYFLNDEHVIYVSLADYLENNYKNIDDNKYNTENLEKSILHQILYSIHPSNLPMTRIYRRDTDRKNFKIWNFIYTFLFVIMIIIFYYCKFGTLVLVNGWISFLTFVLLCIVSYMLVYKFRPKVRFNRLSIEKLELSSDQESNNESLLNKYVDELIHAFQFSDYDVVVFEDIDRLSNYYRQVFARLKNINTLINNAINRNRNENKLFSTFFQSREKEVQFIYLVQNDIFGDPSDKVKFFDAIIDVIPFCNAYNSSSFVSNLINENNVYCKVDEDIIKSVSHSISDPRLIYDITNEYNLMLINYNRKLDYFIDQEDTNQLFYLAVYKVLYPKRFAKLYQCKGIISFYFSSDFEEYVINSKKAITRSRIKEYLENYSFLSALKIHTYEDLYKYFLGVLKKYFGIKRVSDIKIYYYMRVSYNFSNLKNRNKGVQDLKRNDLIFTCGDQKANIDKIFENNVDVSASRFRKILEVFENFSDSWKYEDYITSLQEKLDRMNIYDIIMDDKIAFLKKIADKKIISMYELDKGCMLNAFEERMLRSGALKNNYSELISQDINGVVTQNAKDLVIIRKIRDNVKQKADTSFVLIDKAFSTLSTSDFTLDSICLNDIFRYLITLKDFKKYLNVFFDNIDMYKIEFLVNLSKLDEEFHNKNIFKILDDFINNIWEEIEKNRDLYSQNIINDLVVITVKYSSSKIIKENSIFYDFIIAPGIDDIFNKPLVEDINIRSNLKNYRKIIYTKEGFKKENKEFIEYIYENNMYKDNIEFCKNIFQLENINYDSKKYVDNILKLKNNRLEMYNMYLKDIYVILKINYSNNTKFNDSYENVKWLLNESDFEFTDNQKEYVLDRELCILEDIKWIPKNAYLKYLENGRIKASWSNAFELFKANENSFYPELINYIKTNIDLLTMEIPSSSIFANYTTSLLSFEGITYDEFEKIVSVFSKIRHFTSLPNFSDDKLDVLLRYEMINFNEENISAENFRKILSNGAISLDAKDAFITIHEKYICELDELVDSPIILQTLLLSSINKDYKEHLIEKYNSTEYFNDDVKMIVFNIVKKNEVLVSKEIIFEKLLRLDVNFVDKQRLIMNNVDIIGDSLKETLKYLSDDYTKLYNKGHGYIFIDDSYFLDFLKQRKIINEIKPRKKKCYVKLK